jgi:beta-glucosidase
MLNFSDDHGERIVEPGEFDIMVGSSSRDIHLTAMVTVVGSGPRVLPFDWRMLSEVNYTIEPAMSPQLATQSS